MALGANVMCLGEDRVLSTAGGPIAQRALRALGLTVYDPDLWPFTMGGGGPHCLAQPLRRGASSAVDPRRAIANLRELDRLTGGPGGARRVCWTDEWERARAFLDERLGELPVDVERDAAGNAVGRPWRATGGDRRGRLSRRLGARRRLARRCARRDRRRSRCCGRSPAAGRPPRTVALVDWADEEGARFGRSLLGSSAFAGTLDVDAVARLTDADGRARFPTRWPRTASTSRPWAARGRGGASDGRLPRAAHRAGAGAGGRGPALRRRAGQRSGSSAGGVVFTGRPAHAGSTPMDRRRDAGVAAAREIVGLQGIGRRARRRGHRRAADLAPGIVTAVPGRAELLVDQRHLDPGRLAAMLAEAERALAEAPRRRAVARGRADLAHRAGALPRRAGGAPPPRRARRPRAAARRCPAARSTTRPRSRRVCPRRDGVQLLDRRGQPRPEEDTPEADLERALAAFGDLVHRVVAGACREVGPGADRRPRPGRLLPLDRRARGRPPGAWRAGCATSPTAGSRPGSRARTGGGRARSRSAAGARTSRGSSRWT